MAITVSAGDSGYGVSFPAASSHVVAVGGTTLTQASGSRGWAETAWSGTGSGCSAYEPKPSWQADGGCAGRTDNDVSAVADPNTGLAVYDSYDQGGWVEVGGTSAASPIIAATYALGGYPAAGSYPASFTYAQSAPLFDVTSGANGSCNPAYLCTAGPGYDGPTGLGTPNGVAAFTTGGGPGNEVAFQANTGHLWVEGSGGTADTGLVMMADTSPALAELPPENNPFFPNGGPEAVFQGSDGHPWDYSASGGGGRMSNSVFMAPGTSPAIVPTPDAGAFQALWQGANNHLWTTGAGPTDTGLAMMPGTSPNITALS